MGYAKINFVEKIDAADIWDGLTLALLLREKSNLLDKYRQRLINSDAIKSKNSTSLVIFPILLLRNMDNQYLQPNVNQSKKQWIAQLRLFNTYNNRIILKGNRFTQFQDKYCHYYLKSNSLIHIISKFSRFESRRRSIANKITDSEQFLNMLAAPDCNEINIIEKLLVSILFSTSEEEK